MDYWWEVTPRPSHQERMKRLQDLAAGHQIDQVPLDVALQNAARLVDDAIDKFIEFGMPFLRDGAHVRGIEFSLS